VRFLTDMESMQAFLFLILLLNSSLLWAKESWHYTSFPYVKKNDQIREGEMRNLNLGKKKLHGLLASHAASVRKWGVEQVYVSNDFKKRVFVKYRLGLSSASPIGSWIRLSKDKHIFHFKKDNVVVAYLAQGLTNVEMMAIQKQISSQKTASFFNPFFPNAHADEVVFDSVESTQGTPSALSNRVLFTQDPNFIHRVGGISVCVGEEAWSNAKKSAAEIWDNATWENIRSAPGSAATAIWEAVPSREEIKDGVESTYEVTRNVLAKTPNEIWDGVVERWETSQEAVAKIADEISRSVEGFQNLSYKIQDRIICDAIVQLAPTGVIGIASGIITGGAGATLAAVKLTSLVSSYVRRIRPLMTLVRSINQHSGSDDVEKLRQIDNLLRGRMSTEERRALDARVGGTSPSNDVRLAEVEGEGIFRLSSTDMSRLTARYSPNEMERLERVINQVNQGVPLSLDDAAQAAEMLNSTGRKGLVAFHRTQDSAVSAIQSSGEVRPGWYLDRVFALPVYRPGGNGLATTGKVVGNAVITFQGQAAKLFADRQIRSGADLLVRNQQHQVTPRGRVVIDQAERLPDGTLVITKARIEPLNRTIGQNLLGATDLVLGQTTNAIFISVGVGGTYILNEALSPEK
jgi:hypothetical protein